MLGQRRRRWANIEPALAECIAFAGHAYTQAHFKIYILSHFTDKLIFLVIIFRGLSLCLDLFIRTG